MLLVDCCHKSVSTCVHTVARKLKVLKKTGQIERLGSERSGHWRVSDQG